MDITFKAGIFKDGTAYALVAILNEGKPDEKRKSVPFPSPQEPIEAAKALNLLAIWIKQESRNVP